MAWIRYADGPLFRKSAIVLRVTEKLTLTLSAKLLTT